MGLSVQVQSLEILSLDNLGDHLKKVGGDISLLLCETLFPYIYALSDLILQSLTAS